jgi:hypothetical protein
LPNPYRQAWASAPLLMLVTMASLPLVAVSIGLAFQRHLESL